MLDIVFDVTKHSCSIAISFIFVCHTDLLHQFPWSLREMLRRHGIDASRCNQRQIPRCQHEGNGIKGATEGSRGSPERSLWNHPRGISRWQMCRKRNLRPCRLSWVTDCISHISLIRIYFNYIIILSFIASINFTSFEKIKLNAVTLIW